MNGAYVFDGKNWRRKRSSTVFRQGLANSGTTTIWTPTTGNFARVLKYSFEISGDATLGSAGELAINLSDGGSAITGTSHTINVPAVALNVGVVYQSPVMDLGDLGFVSAAVNNVIGVQLGTALTNGKCRIRIWGTEELPGVIND